MNRRFISTVLISSVAPALVPAAACACAVCLTGAAGDPVADAFSWSVLFLMATPYAVVGSIVGWLAYTYRRASAKRENAAREKPLIQLAWNHKESGR
jgi:Na+/H+ antiporter NhaB